MEGRYAEYIKRHPAPKAKVKKACPRDEAMLSSDKEELFHENKKSTVSLNPGLNELNKDILIRNRNSMGSIILDAISMPLWMPFEITQQVITINRL